jgi:hypothetical protein
MKGVFNKSPPVPKYTDTWVSRESTGDTIKTLGDNKTMHMKQLSLKLAMLMALSSAGTSSELTSLSVDYMTDAAEYISFQLHKVYKTTKPGKHLMKLFFGE